jgi:hypothetical protein
MLPYHNDGKARVKQSGKAASVFRDFAAHRYLWLIIVAHSATIKI